MRTTSLVLVAASVALAAGWYVHLRAGGLDARWLWLLAFAILSVPLALSLLLRAAPARRRRARRSRSRREPADKDS